MFKVFTSQDQLSNIISLLYGSRICKKCLEKQDKEQLKMSFMLQREIAGAELNERVSKTCDFSMFGITEG
jgi:hypothetical protein